MLRADILEEGSISPLVRIGHVQKVLRLMHLRRVSNEGLAYKW
jgi:hypothetical protein